MSTPVNSEPSFPTKAASPTRAALIAAWHSTYITAAALFLGMLTNAYSSGSCHTIEDYVAFFRANTVGWIVAQVVAPAYRALMAQRNAST